MNWLILILFFISLLSLTLSAIVYLKLRTEKFKLEMDVKEKSEHITDMIQDFSFISESNITKLEEKIFELKKLLDAADIKTAAARRASDNLSHYDKRLNGVPKPAAKSQAGEIYSLHTEGVPLEIIANKFKKSIVEVNQIIHTYKKLNNIN